MDISAFLRHIALQSHHCLGYPENLSIDADWLKPLLGYHINNCGDPFKANTHQINSKEIEVACLEWFANIYQLSTFWGYITSGGTESNMAGLYNARNRYPDGVLYTSDASHYSLFKIATLLKLPCVSIKTDADGEMDYNDLQRQLCEHPNQPAIINANIGTTMTGAIDDINQLLPIVRQHPQPFYLHYDAALSGMIVPFVRTLPSVIDFARYPIDSIAVSGHKFIGSPFPYGIFLIRKQYIDQNAPPIAYVGSPDTTITGSRNGLAPLLLWDALQKRQHSFTDEVAQCITNAHYLNNALMAYGYQTILHDRSIIVAFNAPPPTVCHKWQLATQHGQAHVVVMQHVTRQIIDAFLADISACRTQIANT